MKLKIVFAARAVLGDHQMYLKDTCAGGAWSLDSREAVCFETREELIDALEAAEIESFSYAKYPLEIVELIEKARG